LAACSGGNLALFLTQYFTSRLIRRGRCNLAVNPAIALQQKQMIKAKEKTLALDTLWKL